MQTLDVFRQAFERLPAAARSPQRSEALERLLQFGLPGRAQEDYKYTDLATLLREIDPLPVLPDDGAALPARADGDGLDALNAAFASGGVDLQIPANQAAGTIRLDGRGHRRHRVRVGRQAQAELRLETTPEDGFQSVFLDLHLEAGAQVRLLRLAAGGEQSDRLTRIRAQVQRDAQLDISTLDLGGRLGRHEAVVHLAESGAQATVRGLFAVDGQGHIDNYTRVEHHATHGSSREFYRGLARDRGRGIFRGAVIVHPGAQKTDSEQRVASLLLSPGAEIDAKPELEIYADDVKCAHGATFGQLDRAALFYLRSRGLPEAQARALLTLAFALEPLRQIPVAAFRDECLQRVAAYLGADVAAADFSATDSTDGHG